MSTKDNFEPKNTKFREKEMTLRPQAWDEIFQKEGRVYHETFPRFDWLVQQFKYHGCERILDLGCGSGRHVLHLTKLGFDVMGLDYSPTGIQLAKQWLYDERMEAPILQADMRSPLPFKSNAFQGILSTQVIHHTQLATIRSTVDEIWRILTPGGLAFVTVPAHRNVNEGHVQIESNSFVPTEGSEKGLPHHIFTLDEFCSLFDRFQILEAAIKGAKVITILATKV